VHSPLLTLWRSLTPPLHTAQVGDLKLRLGMDLESPALALALPDMEKVMRYLRETLEKVRSGVDFYVTGTKVRSSPYRTRSGVGTTQSVL
jgi:hypothetical protein